MTGFHRNWRSVPTNFVHFIFSILLCLPYSTSVWLSGTWNAAMGSPYACLLRPSHDNPLVTLCRFQTEIIIIYYSHQYHRDLTNDGWYSSLGAAWLPPPQHVKTNKLIAKFKHVGPNPDGSWDYYADKNKKQALSLDQIAMLPEMKGCHFFTTHH